VVAGGGGVKAGNASENAKRVIKLEDWMRAWPQIDPEVRKRDDRARQVGLRLRRAPEHVREAAFSKLWWSRFVEEPTIADLVRVGVPFEEAEKRVDRRLSQFERAFRGDT
jgi:hypothetical protein